MKKIDDLLRTLLAQANWDYIELNEYSPECVEEMKSTLNNFLKEAIKEDRKNIAKTLELKDYSGKKHGKSALEFWNGNSFIVEIRENDIINAPQIELE